MLLFAFKASQCAIHALQLQKVASNHTMEAGSNATEEWGYVLTLYHQTSEHYGHLILKNGFRAGHVGWCGAGIYFATSAQATSGKIKGPDSHAGYMIDAQISAILCCSFVLSLPTLALLFSFLLNGSFPARTGVIQDLADPRKRK